MRNGVAVLAISVAAIGAGCTGTTRASRGSSTQAQAQAGQQPTQAQPWQREGQPGATGDRAQMGMMQQCPMTVPGTQVAATETPDGEAITFTTSSPDAVSELRSRVHAMADMHNRHHASGQMGMSGGMHDESAEPGMHGEAEEGSAGSGDESQETDAGTGMGSSGSSGSGMGSSGAAEPGTAHAMHPSHAVVEDVDGGARVVVTADDPTDLQRLQSSIRSHVERMNTTGSCGMGDRTMQHGDAQHQDEQYQQEEREERRQQGQQ